MLNLKEQNKSKVITLAISSVCIILFMFYFLYSYIEAIKVDSSQKNLATEVAYLGQGLLRSSQSVLDKFDEDRYRQINDDKNKIIKAVDMLANGGTLINGTKIPAAADNISQQVAMFKNSVNDIVANINIITNEKSEALSLVSKKESYNKLQSLVLDGLSGLASNYSNLHLDNNTGSQYLSIIGNTYNKLNSESVKGFIDNKDILSDNYISSKEAVVQLINQQALEISKLPTLIQSFPVVKSVKDTLLDNSNKLYANAQNLKNEADEIVNILPKIVSAKKYASQSDKLSSRLDESYLSLSLSINSSSGNNYVWLVSFSIAAFLLVVIIIYIFELLSRTNDVSENNKIEKRYREYTKAINEYLNSFMHEGKLRKNIVIKTTNNSQSSRMLSTLPIIKDIAHAINTEKKDFYGLLREIEIDTANLLENMLMVISHDLEFNKKIDSVLPMLETSKSSITDIFKSAKSMNIESSQSSIIGTNESINETIKRFNKLKETMQESNKIIKKVSEITQSMSDNIDEIRRYSDKMQINALNTEVVTDVIMSQNNDAEKVENVSKVKSYIKNVRDISTTIINQPLKKLEDLSSTTAIDIGEAIRSLEKNTQDIVHCGETMSNSQNLIRYISEESKRVSEQSYSISENTSESMSRLSDIINEFNEVKFENTAAMELKNKIMIKIKLLAEKIADINNENN